MSWQFTSIRLSETMRAEIRGDVRIETQFSVELHVDLVHHVDVVLGRG